MAPQYKLRYFNMRAAAEPIRLIFAHANVEYEDIRVAREDWPELKPSMPWGQMPVLEIDGVYLAQSVAICRYLARKYNLIGETELDAAKCDEYVDAIMDMRQDAGKFFREQDAAKKEELKQQIVGETVPKYLEKFNKILTQSDSGFLVGKKLTYADIFVSYIIDGIVLKVLQQPEALANYPVIQKHIDLVNSQNGIREWIAKRPETPF
ncbi:unnamed protein product [Orchesella dallaii]|uniref:Glutathione S-transferase n=1 Tax=Orchesella dallaii TaxID=48710 RepID=A0ABP1QVX3_9HEXA